MSDARRERLVAVDVLRGLTVITMLLVNDPGDASHRFAMLAHSAWDGCTLADLVFPLFLFVVGITTHLAVHAEPSPSALPQTRTPALRAIWRRAAALFAIGLLLNAWPFFEKSAVAGPDWLPAFARHIVARLAELRVMGVLQRIALTYLAAALLTRALQRFARRVATGHDAAMAQPVILRRVLGVCVAVLLLAYWTALTLIPVPDVGAPDVWGVHSVTNNLSAYLDRRLLDWSSLGLGWHLWDRAVPYDPEGLLSTIPAVATVLLGVMMGGVLTASDALRSRVRRLTTAGSVMLMVGALWSLVWPLNKPLWSGSYVLVTAGVASVLLGGLVWLVDMRGQRAVMHVPLVFGTNPMVAYAGSELLANILRSSIKWRVDGQLMGTDRTVASMLERAGASANVASLAWAVLFVALWYAMLRRLYVRRIMIRI